MGQIFVPDDLVLGAKEHGFDMEKEVAAFLRRRIACLEAETWLAENREAVEAYNADVAENGLLLDDYRLF